MLALAAIASSAHAALGESESSVGPDAATMKMQLRPASAPSARYRLYAMHDAARNTHVREYARSDDGKVFAVAWEGPVRPDLRQILGTQYFERYVSAAQGMVRVRGARNIEGPGFALRMSGHMRHLAGVAWIPALVPQGVDPSEIR
jgi:hypothetical protein